jgi:hypothetical protein
MSQIYRELVSVTSPMSIVSSAAQVGGKKRSRKAVKAAPKKASKKASKKGMKGGFAEEMEMEGGAKRRSKKAVPKKASKKVSKKGSRKQKGGFEEIVMEGGAKKRSKKSSKKSSKKGSRKQKGGFEEMEMEGGAKKRSKKAASKKVSKKASKKGSKKGMNGGKREMPQFMKDVLEIKRKLKGEFEQVKDGIPLTSLVSRVYKDNDKNVGKTVEAISKMVKSGEYAKQIKKITEDMAAKRAQKKAAKNA